MFIAAWALQKLQTYLTKYQRYSQPDRKIATIPEWDHLHWSPSTMLIWICNLSNIKLNISPSHFTFAISHWVGAMGPANRLYQIAKRSFIKSDQDARWEGGLSRSILRSNGAARLGWWTARPRTLQGLENNHFNSIIGNSGNENVQETGIKNVWTLSAIN